MVEPNTREESRIRNSVQLHSLRLWVALPDAERKREPGFNDCKDPPVVEPGGGAYRLPWGNARQNVVSGETTTAAIVQPGMGRDCLLLSSQRQPMDGPCRPRYSRSRSSGFGTLRGHLSETTTRTRRQRCEFAPMSQVQGMPRAKVTLRPASESAGPL